MNLQEMYILQQPTMTYDGAIWKEFLTDQAGVSFLSGANNYAFLLNIDWFQPFVHVTYSVGVIYMVFLNLPRCIRYKRENVLLLGVIPGPSEPPLTINSYLTPIVKELKTLWEGVSFRLVCNGRTVEQTFRGALIGVACDLPATRKVCGFLGHTANLGCSKCLVKFSEGFNKQNYSNFDRETWVLRSNTQHRGDIKKVMEARNKTNLAKLESEYGCRYSVLLDLPYFDPVRMHLVDPMHNLYLGTAKHFMLNILIGRDILTKENLMLIEQRLQKLHIPIGLGHIPTRIDTSTFLTAEQWMNWTNYFSIYCLRDLIPSEQLECWRHFVLASRFLCKLHIKSDDITKADALLLRFCRRMFRIYGNDSLTPNMHLHLHLVNCIKDYGPFRSFWLYPFERYNGVLGNQPNNNKAVKMQLMRRFQSDSLSIQMVDHVKTWPLKEHFESLLPLSTHIQDVGRDFSYQDNPSVTLGSKSTISVLSPDEVVVMRKVYAQLYPEYSTRILSGEVFIATAFHKFTYITWNEHRIKSSSCNTSSYILATPLFEFDSGNQHVNDKSRVAKVVYFFTHSVSLPGCNDQKLHTFAYLHWPMNHPDCYKCGKPVELWCNELFEPSNVNCIIPIENITNIVITSIDCILPSNENVLFVIPL